MKLLNFAIIKITLYLIIGILFAHYFKIPSSFILPLTLALPIGLFIILYIEKKRLVKSVAFGILTAFTFIAIGIFTYQTHDQKQFKRHYTQHFDPETDSVQTITFRIREVLKPGVNHDRYIVDLLKINTKNVVGKTLLNVRKDSVSPLLKVDDLLIAAAPLQKLNASVNPHQFDYKAYLENQYIYHQIYAENDQLLRIRSTASTIFGYAAQLRNHINFRLKQYHFKPDELALINALILGQRQDISPDILDSYSKAGAIHILAVSGLHVGIILLLLNSVFKPLEYLKRGKTLKIILIVIILWSFAIVAGLSASVTRAVTMFSIVAIGMNLKRPSNIFNTLAISVFFLLLFKPLFLFDVGFQMSYLAVIAIVSIQPLIVKLWRPKLKPIKKLWDIFTVTMAAQIGVVPISLFYFHQFPGLFFVSNLVIIPVLGVILGTGILVIFLALLNILPFWLADLYGGIISMMNGFVRWVSLQEAFVFTDISFSLALVFSAYLLIIAWFLFFKQKNFKRLAIAMMTVLIFQSTLIFEGKKQQTEEFVIFHKSRSSLIAQKTNATLAVFHNMDSISYVKDHALKSYSIGNAISKTTVNPIEDIYLFHDKKLLVIDSLGIYQIPDFNPDYILLRNSPKINLTRVLDSLKPQLVIADGSNYKSYLEQWEATCAKQKIPLHLTGKAGAFVFRKE